MAPLFPEEITRIITRDDMTLAYSGEFRDTLTDRIIELAETYLASDTEISKLRKKTSFLVAECFQNVIRHGSREAEFIFDSPRRVESFVLRFHEQKCFILSENAIHGSRVEELASMLEDVNKVDSEELRKMYRELLHAGELSEKGGAGLGLIEMARRSGHKLKYSFEPIDEQYQVFHLMLVLGSEKSGEASDYSGEFIEIERILTSLKKENHFLVYHGAFDAEFNAPLGQMIERNLDAQARPLALKVKYYNAALLLMELVASHTLSLEENEAGVVAFGITGDGYKIHSTSFVSRSLMDDLSKLLKNLQEMIPVIEEVKADQLLLQKNNGLGKNDADNYLQLARIGRSWIYNFRPHREAFEFNYHILI